MLIVSEISYAVKFYQLPIASLARCSPMERTAAQPFQETLTPKFPQRLGFRDVLALPTSNTAFVITDELAAFVLREEHDMRYLRHFNGLVAPTFYQLSVFIR